MHFHSRYCITAGMLLCAVWLSVNAHRRNGGIGLGDDKIAGRISPVVMATLEPPGRIQTSEAVSNRVDITGIVALRGGASSLSVYGFLKKAVKSVFSVFGGFLPSSWTGSKNGKRYGSNNRRKGKKRKSSGSAYASSDSTNRIQKEIQDFMENPPDNCKLEIGKNIRTWIVTLTGVEGTIYSGEKYKLKLQFSKDYPSKPPSVYFLKPCPKHMHVYTNGDICLNFLGKDWRPNMTGQMLAVSILSMLSSAKEKKIPQDNAMHSDNAPGQQQDNWMYHDDRC